jgi:hypothetical protein
MRIALALTAALMTAVCPATGSAKEVLFYEHFDPGFTAAGWVLNQVNDGSWSVDSSVYHLTAGSLRLDGLVGNLYLSRDMGQSMENTIFEAWFYDGLESQKETYVSVSADANYLGSTGNHLRIGVDYCASASGSYRVVEGFTGPGGPARSLGWHKATFENVGGINRCYIDGQLVDSTAFQGNWRYLILNEENSCPGTSWFDDVLVYRPGTAFPVDPTHSTATGGMATTILTCPARDGPSLASGGATIQVRVRDVAGNLVTGFPSADIWLSIEAGDAVAFCPPRFTADHDTDASGQTTISGTPAAGGCSQAGLRVMLAGQPITGSPPLPISVNSPDMTGDLRVNLGDIGPFSAALNGAYIFCADFYRDNVINLVDVSIMSQHLGHVCQ